MKSLLLLLAACLLGGCATSPWESSYVGSRLPQSDSREPLRIQTVPWNRLDAALQELEAETARSDIPPADWPPERKADAHAKLIRGLQIQLDPREVEVLGRSEFATTESVRPNSESGRGELATLASKVGADLIVWSSHSLGMTDHMVDRPMYNNRLGTFGGDPAMRATNSGNDAMWIPIHEKAERTAYIAFFLRYTPAP